MFRGHNYENTMTKTLEDIDKIDIDKTKKLYGIL